jgi:hypothetical protein
MSVTVGIFFFAGLIFGELREFPDLALECRDLSRAKAEVVELPSASAYLVNEDGEFRLEDRYDVFELWRSESLRACWKDEEGSRFQLSRIVRTVPGGTGGDCTRSEYERRYVKAKLGAKDLDALDEAVYQLSPVEVLRRIKPRRSQRQNLAELWQYETTNDNALVFAFRPKVTGKKKADWYALSLVSEDPEAEEKIDKWLDEVTALVRSGEKTPENQAKGKSAVDERKTESELLSRDYHRSVINYSDWNFAAAENVVVVDNLSSVDRQPFVQALTNSLPKLQAAYRAAMPSQLSEDCHLAAVRVFGSREEYIAYVGEEMKWSAAMWSPRHRELVLFYPESGAEELLRTVWHEAFHQYIEYACSMIQSSVWFNEGHAQLFENTHFDMDGNVVFDVDRDAAMFIKTHLDELTEYLPVFLELDYPQFYAEAQEERTMNYRLAWSMAYFLQIGAPQVRFQPFKNLRTDYMKALVRTRDRNSAIQSVLTEEMRKELIAEWREFWKRK